MATFDVCFCEEHNSFDIYFVETNQFDVEFQNVQQVHVLPDPYDGEYSWVPTSHEQIIPIAGLSAVKDIVVKPIPQNYGLITWSGLGIRVS